MIEATPKSIFYYHLEDFESVKSDLLALWSRKQEIVESDKTAERIFKNLEPLVASLNNYKKDNLMDAIDMNTIAFIPSGLIRSYLDTRHPELRDLLVYQIRMVGAATMNVSELNFTPYNFEEIRQMQDGEDNIFNNFIYAYTLREMMDLSEPDDRIAAVFSEFESMPEDREYFEEYFWEEALLFSLSVNLIWKNFAFFGSVQQDFILKNYLYVAVVIGFPIEKILSFFLGIEEENFDAMSANSFFLKSFEENKESVPLKTDLSEVGKLSDLFKKYISKVYSGDIKTLIQEKFLQDIYRGQEGEVEFSEWLRNALKVYYSIRSKDYIKK